MRETALSAGLYTADSASFPDAVTLFNKSLDVDAKRAGSDEPGGVFWKRRFRQLAQAPMLQTLV
jgi:hypothetical protein